MSTLELPNITVEFLMSPIGMAFIMGVMGALALKIFTGKPYKMGAFYTAVIGSGLFFGTVSAFNIVANDGMTLLNAAAISFSGTVLAIGIVVLGSSGVSYLRGGNTSGVADGPIDLPANPDVPVTEPAPVKE